MRQRVNVFSCLLFFPSFFLFLDLPFQLSRQRQAIRNLLLLTTLILSPEASHTDGPGVWVTLVIQGALKCRVRADPLPRPVCLASSGRAFSFTPTSAGMTRACVFVWWAPLARTHITLFTLDTYPLYLSIDLSNYHSNHHSGSFLFLLLTLLLYRRKKNRPLNREDTPRDKDFQWERMGDAARGVSIHRSQMSVSLRRIRYWCTVNAKSIYPTL